MYIYVKTQFDDHSVSIVEQTHACHLGNVYNPRPTIKANDNTCCSKIISSRFRFVWKGYAKVGRGFFYIILLIMI